MSGGTSRLGDIRRRLRGTSGRGRRLRGLLGLLRPYRLRVAGMFASLVLGTAAALAPAPLAKLAIDDGITAGNRQALTLVVIAFVVAAGIVWVATYAQTYLVEWVGQRALADLRIAIFDHLQKMPIGFYERRPAGVLISRMTNDVEALDDLVTDSVVTLFQASLTLIGTLVILVALDLKLALLTFAVVPVIMLGSLVFRIASADAYRRTRETIGRITSNLQETISGIRVVRAFGQEPRHVRRFAELNEANRAANMTTVYLNAAYFPAIEMIAALATVAILIYGGYQAIDGAITIGVIVAFIAAVSNFFDPITQLSQLYTTYQSGMAALDKIFELLDVEPDLVGTPDAIELGRLRGEIRFEGVTFAYSTGRPTASVAPGGVPAGGAPAGKGPAGGEPAGGEPAGGEPAGEGSAGRGPAGKRSAGGAPAGGGASDLEVDAGQPDAAVLALDSIDLVVEPGQTVALVGATGAGKSTFAKLVARFYDPTEGRVLVDGHDLRDVETASLRSQMGIVPQEAFLFSGTVGENIAFGRPEATLVEIRAAAAAVGADDFISGLDDGYETEVGERGAQISAGQRQLLAFARALIADPRILVLDEATSNVDLHTEGRIEAGLQRLLAGRTALVIAHRLSTIRSAGRIVVLDHGRIVEQGTHDELIGAGGAYWELYRDWSEQTAVALPAGACG